MKNDYIEKILDDISNGEEVNVGKAMLAKAYTSPMYKKHGRICLDGPFLNGMDAAAFAQNLSLSGINELYVTCQYSNQMDYWFLLDAFGLKLRGIQAIENMKYEYEMEHFGRTYEEEGVTALRFSFREEDK